MAGEHEVPQPVAPPEPAPQPASLESRLESRLGPSTGEAPAPPPAPQPGQSPAGGVASPEQQAADQSQWQSIRDYAKQRGMDLPWQDDNQAVDNLLQSYQQLQERNYYADLGRQVAPHADSVREWIGQRQAQQQQSARAPSAWEAPPFREEWLAMVERDPETGVLRSKPGYDPSIPERVQAYSDWRDKFLRNPESVIGPLVEERARQIVRQEQGQFQEQSLAQDLIRREATWLFQGGAVGGQLTPAGRMYGQVANSLHQAGLRDVAILHNTAVAFVQNAYLRSQRQQQAVAPSPTAVAQAETPVSLAGALTRPGSSAPRRPPTAPDMRGLTLRERLNKRFDQRFDQAGIPDNAGFQGG